MSALANSALTVPIIRLSIVFQTSQESQSGRFKEDADVFLVI
jgi:hypothetical protein